MKKSTKFLICFLVTSIFSAPATAEDKIYLSYMERLPFVETKANGDVEGLVATPAKLAMRQAGLAFEWKAQTTEEQLFLMKTNRVKACLVGWFKNAKREKLGKFSNSLYDENPTVALALEKNNKLAEMSNVSEVMRNKKLSLLVKDGYSYGRELDALMLQYHPKTVIAKGRNINMLGMLVYERADYFFTSLAEADALIDRAPYDKKQFKIIRFVEGLRQEPRYLWCTLQVPDLTMSQINEAIAKVRSGH